MSARSVPFHLPADPLPRFLAIYEACRNSGPWYDKLSGSMRHAAMALVSMEGRPTELVRRMRSSASALKSESSVFSPLKGSLRYVFAAHLMAMNVSAGRLISEFDRLKGFLKDENLPRMNSPYVMVATLVLVEQSVAENGSPRISRDQVVRMGALFRAFKSDHRWLTGEDDLGPAAILMGSGDPPLRIAAQSEEIYRSLRAQKYSLGNSLQAVSHLLYLHPGSPSQVVQRFDAIYQAFKSHKLWMMDSDYDEVAALCFTNATPEKIAARTQQLRADLRSKGYGLSKNENFSIAACLAMLELLSSENTHADMATFSLIVRVQAMIQAQQAAAAIAASSAAAAAAAG